MQETKINWTELTWNPASGCDVISEECAHCYALTLAENRRGTLAFPNGFDITMRPHKLKEPARIKQPSLIFTNSMTDMFHKDIPDEYRDQILEAMRRSPQHRYQVLTKRPEIAEEYFRTRAVPDCMWLGVTVGHYKRLGRVDILRRIPARTRFLSIEPLLTALDGSQGERWGALDVTGIDWVITGGESGVHLVNPAVALERALARRATPAERKAGARAWVPREDRYGWIRHIRDICVRAGVAYYHKQWGGTRPESAGRLVDGRTWDEMPMHALPEGYRHFERAPAHKDGHLQVSLPVVQG